MSITDTSATEPGVSGPLTSAARCGWAREVRLDITGMTCAACAARIEKRLNRLPGVAAR